MAMDLEACGRAVLANTYHLYTQQTVRENRTTKRRDWWEVVGRISRELHHGEESGARPRDMICCLPVT